LTEIEGILADGLSIVRERAMSRRIGLKLEIGGALGSMLADQRKIKQIIYNLLSNAVKFSHDNGMVVLRANVAKRSEIENWSTAAPTQLCCPLPASDFERFLEISVADCGHGIAPEDAPRLFKAFSQLDSSLARESEGTGLGLALVLELAYLHMGTVALASTPGHGSCFTVWLPWREAATQQTAAPQAAAKIESASRDRQVALIVEDNAHAAELISMQLNSEGFQILHAASGRAALDMLESELPNLILLDILLPDMDGWDLLTHIKRAESELASVPVVIVSIVADAARGLLLGAAKVLQKPYRREDLLSAIKELGLGCRLPVAGGKEQVST
jgi:CheY-like chemotaxis protein